LLISYKNLGKANQDPLTGASYSPPPLRPPRPGVSLPDIATQTVYGTIFETVRRAGSNFPTRPWNYERTSLNSTSAVAHHRQVLFAHARSCHGRRSDQHYRQIP